MARLLAVMPMLFVFTQTVATAAPARVTAQLDANSVSVSVDGKPFTAYKFGPSQKYPYFFPVNGPASGESVTTETSEPYPHHHSLFFGCDRVDGGNYWQESNEKGQIVSQGPKIKKAKGKRVVFTDECLWQLPGKELVMRDTRRITVTAPDASLRLIDFEITLKPLKDIRIEKTNHSLFSARMAPDLCVKGGGTLVNDKGQKAEAGTFGVPSPWCDYYGKRKDTVEGLAILQHPSNRWYPAPWFTRDYGFFSPTPMQWLENGKLDLPKGKPITLKYRVVVHEGTPDIATLQAEYAGE